MAPRATTASTTGAKTARSGGRAEPTTAFSRLTRAGQITLGLIWLLDGILQFQPSMFGRGFITAVLLPNASGQPWLIGAPITWIAHFISSWEPAFNAAAALLQVMIGLGLIVSRRTVKPALAASMAWALGIWFAGEGLGGLFNNTADPLTGAPGAAVVYLVLGMMVWPAGETTIGSRRIRTSALGLLGARGARTAWATLWSLSALLWLMPANNAKDAVAGAINAAPSGAGWLTRLLGETARASAGSGVVIATVLAGLSAAIAVGVQRGWHTRAFLNLSIAVSVVFWVVGQGFGGVFTGQATDVNTAPLLILMAVLLHRADTIGTAGHRPPAPGALTPAE